MRNEAKKPTSIHYYKMQNEEDKANPNLVNRDMSTEEFMEYFLGRKN